MIQASFPEFMPESNWRPPDHFPNIGEAKWWSMDIESRDPNLRARGPGFIREDAYVVGVAIHTDGFSGYFPVRHAQGSNLAPNVVFDWLKDQAHDFHGDLYGGNLLYDEEGLWHEGVVFHDDVKRCDIQIAEPLIDEETAKGYSVEVLSQKYLDVGKEEELLKETASRYTKGFKDKRARRPIAFDPKSDLWMMPPEFVGAYAEGDVDRPRRIFEQQKKILDKEGLQSIFDLETSLVPILLKMRIKGVSVDEQRAYDLKKTLSKEIDKYSIEIKNLVGFDPNVDSGQDMLKAYESLNARCPEFQIMSRLKYTAPSDKHPNGQASFTADWYVSQKDPLSTVVLKKKKLMTMRDDFVEGDILKEAVKGRIHCQFQQLKADDSGTRSGRMSSKNPNLQQVPARHDDNLWGPESPNWAEEVRKIFVADSGMLYCKGDVSQQEPRLLVHFADLCKLDGASLAVAAFNKNPKTDYHQLTTDIVNATTSRQPPFKRKQIKAINLGVMYGMGLQKLCRMLGLSIPEGQEILSAYHQSLPFVKSLSNKAMTSAQERGFIWTILRRKRRFDLWEPIADSREEREFKQQPLSRNLAENRWPGKRLQRAGVHKALNALIQGSAADQTKMMMRNLYYDFGKIPHLQVHDELGFSVADVEEARLVKRAMQDAVILRIPVVCDVVLGPSWGAAKQEVELCLN